MEKILNQEEVDALLKGISEGDVETENRQDFSEDYVSYDLTSQDRIIRGRMPTMEIINERFAREATMTLLRFLGKTVEVGMDSFKLIKYGEFIKKLPVPASLSIFRADPFKGTSLFFFESKLVFLIVDILFGGPGRFRMKIEGRDFTVIENRIIQKLLDLLFADLKKAWSLLEDMTFTFVRSELNPQFANIVAPTDIVLATYFDVETEWERSTMGYCIPYTSVEPIKDRLYGRFQSEYVEVDQTWKQAIGHHLRKIPMEVSVEVGTTKISLRDLLHLKIGDVVRLETKPSDPILMKIHEREKATCMAGQRNGNYAVEVVSLLDDPNKEKPSGLPGRARQGGRQSGKPIHGDIVSREPGGGGRSG